MRQESGRGVNEALRAQCHEADDIMSPRTFFPDTLLSHAEMTSLLDAAPDAMVITDGSGTITLVNAQAETLFGYSRDELLGRPVEFLLPARLREAHAAQRETYADASSVRPMGSGLELLALRKDGSEFPVEISLSPLEAESGLLILSATRDITALKAAQNALIEAHEEADRANRAKSAFLAAASHDLRQPLQALTLSNGALAKAAPAGSRIAEMAAIQEVAIRSMSDLLSSLLDISRLEAGAIEPDLQNCCLQTMLERLEAQFSAQADAKRLKLRLDACAAVVHTDPALLEQIVQNLVANAIRYTEHGYVHVRCEDSAGAVRIEVRDTGIGIPVSDQDMIFVEFYRIDSGQRRGHEKGLGLGLSIVRRMADLLGHRLEVESVPGEGSCFAVIVPKGESLQARAPADPASPETSREHFDGIVLIVDDEAAVADATAMLLEVTGYRAIVASSFDEAQRRLVDEGRAPDVLICDFHLAGGETGIETIERIRRLAARPIPAVLVTGDISVLMSNAQDRVQDCSLLSKPVDPEELLALVECLTSGDE